MNIYKKLVNNSLIFAVGNLGTKLLIFFLVPLYTFYLTEKEFGMVDLLTTTLSFLIPIFTLSVFDSVLRFAMDEKYDKQAVLSNSLIIIIIGFFLLISLYPLFVHILPFNNYMFYFYTIVLLQAINTTLTQYVRAIGMVKLFAGSGIVNAFILLVSNILFLMVFHMGIVGYLVSLIIANMVSCVFVITLGKIQYDFSTRKLNMILVKEMLIYSVPLIPNALMWWIMGLSDRYIITYYMGLGANGIYAVANKIPGVLNIINSIFFQAWQISAIEEVNSKSKSKFFSNVFNVFSTLMLLSTSFFLIFLKKIADILVSNNFPEVWRYIPFLLLGVVFSSFSGFLGTNYIAAKKTRGVFKTSAIGAIVNIVINLLLVPVIGINGASLGTMLSFLIIWILRVKDTKKFVDLQINSLKIITMIAIISVQIYILYIELSIEYLLQIALFLIMMLVNFSEIKEIVNKILNIIKKKYYRSREM
ncbi:oligosaccharide flippase family protein [Priestia sp. GS2]|uniref:oligosaccharide flippase family protein n=1 Tax=Priestia sp. GS2 TaxID=3117403 RepID=UPI002EDB28F8